MKKTFHVFPDSGETSFSISKAVYSKEALEISAQIFSSRCDVFFSDSPSHFEVSLKAKKKDASEKALEIMAGEFFNELLNQEYRFIVGHFNRNIANLITTQALLSARGGENGPAKRLEEETPEFQLEVKRLMRETEDHIDRVMPKKIPPQGPPIPTQSES